MTYKEGIAVIKKAYSVFQILNFDRSIFVYLVHLVRFKETVVLESEYCPGVIYTSWPTQRHFRSMIYQRQRNAEDNSFRGVLDVLEYIPDEWYVKYYSDAFDYALKLVCSSDRSGSVHLQPKELTDFVLKLSNLAHQNKIFESVYNPFCGLASYLVNENLNIDADGITPENAYGQEINKTTYELAQLRILAHREEFYRCINNCDSLEFNPDDHGENSWGGFIDKKQSEILKDTYRHTFDLIVSTPPWGVKVNPECLYSCFSDGLSTMSYADMIKALENPEIKDNLIAQIGGQEFSRWSLIVKAPKTIEEEFISRGLESLSEDGILSGVFSHKLLYSNISSVASLKQRFINDDLLEYVVGLPAGLFDYTSIPSAVLVFNPNKKVKGKVVFVDGTSFFNKEGRHISLRTEDLLKAITSQDETYVKVVDNAKLARNKYNLMPSSYFIEDEVIPEGYIVKSIGELGVVVKGQSAKVGEEGRIVLASRLSTSIDKWEMSPDEFPMGNIDKNYSFSKITVPVLLITKSLAMRITYVNASEQSPILVPNNIFALRILGDTVHISYLVLELSKIGRNLQKRMHGPHLRIEDILNLSIAFPPSLSVQKKIYETAFLQLQADKVKELNLEAVIEARQKEFYNIMRRRKHDLCNSMSEVRNNVQALAKFLKNNPVGEKIISSSANISVSAHISRLINKLNEIGLQMEKLTDREQFGEPEPIEIRSKLKAIHNSDRYKVIHTDNEEELVSLSGGRSCYVNIAESDWNKLINNIISNAVRHGFKDEKSTYTIRTKLSYDMGTDNYVIEISNNGEPLPKGMDTVKYGIDGECAGSSKGTGAGGAIVKSIVEHYKGSYEVIDAPDEEFPVSIIINLPRYEA